MTEENAVDKIIRESYRLLSEDRDREAVALLEAAMRRFPSDPEIRLTYATGLLALRPEDAPWQFAKAIELDPQDPVRLTRAAVMLFHLGELSAARSYGARAAKLVPPDFVFAPELANLGGLLAALDGDDALAEDGLRAAVEAEPNRESFARDLAKFLAERHRTEEALKVVDDALELTGDREKLERLRSELAS
jgi:Flp pilus assembly protein TadD